MEELDDVRAVGTTQIDDYLSVAYARLFGLDDPLQSDASEARASGYRNVLVPEGQIFLATRVGDSDVAREALGLPEGFGSVVTGLSTDYLKPVEAGQSFTVRVRRLPAPAPPSKRVKEFHQLEYELTDFDGDVAVRQRLTVAEIQELTARGSAMWDRASVARTEGGDRLQTAHKLEPTHPGGLVAAQARDPFRVAVRFPTDQGWGELSRTELAADVGRHVRALEQMGLAAGDRVGVVGSTSVEWLLAGYAAQASGGVLVGAYPTSAPGQLRHVFGHSGCRVVFATTGVLERLLAVVDTLGELERIVLMDGAAPIAASGGVPVVGIAEFLDASAVDDDGAVSVLADAVTRLDPDAVCSIVYTSGTTGDPKGALHSFSTIAQIARTVVPALGYREDDQYVVHLPLNHLAEQTYGMVLGAHLGWTLNFLRSPVSLLDDLPHLRPTVMFGVPRVLEKVRSAVVEAGLQGSVHSDAHPLAPFGLDRLRVLVCGGAPLTPEFVEFFDNHGVKVINAYGMTEGNAITCAWDRPPRGDTCGVPLPGVQVDLARDGEVLVRSLGVCLGYYRDAQATADLFTPDGFIRTGDLGEFTADGELRLVGRKKEIIITAGGKNMSPAMIEYELTKSPFVNQAVVVGNGRRYLVAVLEPAVEAVMEHLAAVGGAAPAAPYEELIVDPRVVELMAQAVEEANATLSQPEQVKRWVILGRRFAPGDPELTPTMKIRRHEFEARNAPMIEELYR